MKEVLSVILGISLSVTAMICLVIWPLYYAGLLTINTKRALVFTGRIGGTSPCKGHFSACSGSMRRIMRFRESELVEFALGVELDKGEMTVELLDGKKHLLMSMDAENPIVCVPVNPSQRYEIVFRFRSATGKYELRWAELGERA